MERFDLIGAVLGSSLVTWVLGKIFSKSKEDIELALNYQDFYKGLINDLEEKVDDLSSKIQTLVERDRENVQTIEEQRALILRYEAACQRSEGIIIKKDKQITKLFKEIQEHENNAN